MWHPDDYSDWEIVPEHKLLEAIEMMKTMSNPGADDMSNFESVLAAGAIFKEAEMTPVYVFDDVTCRLAVYAAETYGKPLH